MFATSFRKFGTVDELHGLTIVDGANNNAGANISLVNRLAAITVADDAPPPIPNQTDVVNHDGGLIHLVATDGAIAGQNITVESGASIDAPDNDVTLQAGDDIELQMLSTINAGLRILVIGGPGCGRPG